MDPRAILAERKVFSPLRLLETLGVQSLPGELPLLFFYYKAWQRSCCVVSGLGPWSESLVPPLSCNLSLWGAFGQKGVFYVLYQKLLDGNVPVLTELCSGKYLRSGLDRSHSAAMLPAGMSYVFMPRLPEVSPSSPAVEAVPQ